MVKAVAVAEPDPVRAELWRQRFPFPLTRDYMHSVAILDRKILELPDVEEAPAELEVGRKNFLASGYRAVTFVPISEVTRQSARSVSCAPIGPLSDKQIAVLKTYASSGRHRHREHAAAQRIAPAHRRSQRVAGAADRDVRSARASSPARRGNWSRCSTRCWRNATRICDATFGYDASGTMATDHLPDANAQRAACGYPRRAAGRRRRAYPRSSRLVQNKTVVPRTADLPASQPSVRPIPIIAKLAALVRFVGGPC